MHSTGVFEYGPDPLRERTMGPAEIVASLKELCAEKGPLLLTDEIVAWIERIGGFETNAELVAFAEKMKARQYARMLEDEDGHSAMRADGPAFESSILEKMISAQSTFMAIDFLETGLERARSVARVICRDGIGSGFLIRDNLLITSSHVICSKEEAEGAKIHFSYQGTASGPTARVGEFTTAPEDGFATSPSVGGDDWTAVRVNGNPNAEWGAIELTEATVNVQDFVSLIQHSGGLPKQVALCSNLVTFADECRVQYLTNTLPGSSGSPVFDNDWRLVALHHRGGWPTEPASKRIFFRNEGIHINVVLRGLIGSGLLRAASIAPREVPPGRMICGNSVSPFPDNDSKELRPASPSAAVDRWRSLVRVVGLSTVDAERMVEAVVPSWDPNRIVRFRESTLPTEIQLRLMPGVRLLAQVNLGETDPEKLVFRDFRLAPLPV
jgi:hypothetical protein